MQERFQELTNQILELISENEIYLKTKKEETFEIDETKTEDEMILEAENILDRKLKIKEMNAKINQMKDKILSTLKITSKEIISLTKIVTEDQQKIEEETEDLIETINDIRQKKTDRLMKQLQDECDKEKNEMRKLWKKKNEECEWISKDSTRKIKIKEHISEICGMEIKELLFDSFHHKWKQNKSEFGDKLKGHRNICVIIEDTKDNIFGGYCSKEIGLYKYHFDSKSFLFSIKRNGKYSMEKYPLKEGYYDFYLCSEYEDVLFAFGAEAKENGSCFRDICITKKDSVDKGYCKPYSYEYNGKENVFCDDNIIDVRRILVYQMEEPIIMKSLRERMEKSEELCDKLRWKNEVNEINRYLYELFDKRIREVLFDSVKDKWNENESEFADKIKGKKEIIILVEDERMNLFGCYIKNDVVVDENVSDDFCSLFRLRKDGEYQCKRFKKNLGGYSYWIPSTLNNYLFIFGIGEIDDLNDLVIMKKDYSSGFCNQSYFNYFDERYALCGKNDFIVKRIVVYQMI